MVMRTGGARRKTRTLYKKDRRRRGKVSLTRFLATFTPGDKVLLSTESSYHKGMYFRRFHGRIGIIEAQRGTCYEVGITDGSIKKTLIVHTVHIKKV